MSKWSNAGLYSALHRLAVSDGEPEALNTALRWVVALEEMVKVGNVSQKLACRRLEIPVEQFIADIRQTPVNRNND